MVMRKMLLNELNPAVRSFLEKVRRNGVVIEDSKGRVKYGIVQYAEASRKQQEAALKRLGRIQNKVGKMMARTGKTEDELDRLLQDD